MALTQKICVLGASGFLGAHLTARLKREGLKEVLAPSRHELDLTKHKEVSQFFQDNSIGFCFLLAAKVGGIEQNKNHQSEFLFENLRMEFNVIQSAFKSDVKKLIFTGSNCAYSPQSPQPFEESTLGQGPFEPTNEGYAIAKIAGTQLCQTLTREHGAHFVTAIPASLYGPGDHFDDERGHVIPMLMRRIYLAKIEGKTHVTAWGTGQAQREFLYVEDAVDALMILMQNYTDMSAINISSGQEVSLRELSRLLCDVIGFKGEILWDTSKPEGVKRKLLSGKKMEVLGWKSKIGLLEGLHKTYQWALNSHVLGAAID